MNQSNLFTMILLLSVLVFSSTNAKYLNCDVISIIRYDKSRGDVYHQVTYKVAAIVDDVEYPGYIQERTRLSYVDLLRSYDRGELKIKCWFSEKTHTVYESIFDDYSHSHAHSHAHSHSHSHSHVSETLRIYDAIFTISMFVLMCLFFYKLCI